MNLVYFCDFNVKFDYFVDILYDLITVVHNLPCSPDQSLKNCRRNIEELLTFLLLYLEGSGG